MNVKINIVAGTSIGGVNAAIIAGSKDGNRPEQLLEQFWLELADSFIDLENVDPFLSPYMERLIATSIIYLQQDRKKSKMNLKERLKNIQEQQKDPS